MASVRRSDETADVRLSRVARSWQACALSSIVIIAERIAPSRGGLAVATARIAQHALASGHEVHVLYPSKDAPPGGRGRKVIEGLVHHPVGALSREDDTLMAWAQHAQDVILAQGAKLVHGVYASRAGYLAALLGRQLKLPSIVSLRGNDLDRGLFRAADLPFLERALTWATAVTGVSSALCAKAEALFGVQPRHITNSVDAQAFSPQAADNSLRATLGLGTGPVLGFLGELREKKGMRYLLPAVDALEGTSLLLIGGVRQDAQEALRAFENMAPEAYQRIKVVEYDRAAERLCRLMALCDLMVFPSLYDGTPNAVLEAMAAARPILATDAGGQRDLIEHGKSGGLLPVGRLDRLPEAIEEFLAMPRAEREKMGKAARQQVIERHAPEHERAAYQALYESLGV